MPPGLDDEYNPSRKLMYPGGVGLRKLCMVSVRRTKLTPRYVRGKVHLTPEPLSRGITEEHAG